jgi:hypothetical protein
VQTGDKVGIAGFIIDGNISKRVVVRGLGPSLKIGNTPIPGTLNDPVLQFYNSSGTLVASNDNWQDDPVHANLIMAAGLAPSDNRESAIWYSAPPGVYTAVLRGKNNGIGIGVIEVYDLDSMSDGQLANLASRAMVNTGDNVLIGGLILTGANPKRILFRALGPDLHAFGVTGELQDPTLTLYDGNGTMLQSNDNWHLAPNVGEIQATGLAPGDDRDSVILMTLTPGNYTAIESGANGTIGVGLLEAYRLD